MSLRTWLLMVAVVVLTGTVINLTLNLSQAMDVLDSQSSTIKLQQRVIDKLHLKLDNQVY